MKTDEMIEVDKLKQHPINPRAHTDEQIEKIAKSINKLGWGRPIIISSDNYILAGHAAYLAAQNILNLKKVPYRRMKHKHDSLKARAYLVADNKLTDDSTWDHGKLRTAFRDLKLEGFDVELTGFGEIVEEDNFDPETKTKTKCKIGNIYKLGNHRLMCGDACNENDVTTLLDNNKIDMVFTDPPFDFEDTSYFLIIAKVANEIFVIHSDKNLLKLANNHLDIFRYFFTVQLTPPTLINNNMPMTGHDLIAYFRTGKSTFNNLHDAFSTHIQLNKRRDEERRHEKRIELPATFIRHFTSKNDNVLDLFGGLGSTLIACEQLQRKCFMMEIDPHYCDLIIVRWEEFTNEKVKKIN